jgi:hypothetical protein
MRFANPHPPRRGAFLLIALFSCLQILFGFFLFTGNRHDSVLPPRSSVQIASYDDGILFNDIQPATGYISEKPTATIALKKSCSGCGTFSFFDEYRRKAREKASAHQHAAYKMLRQKKHIQNSLDEEQSRLYRYNPINRRVIVSNSSQTTLPSYYDE